MMHKLLLKYISLLRSNRAQRKTIFSLEAELFETKNKLIETQNELIEANESHLGLLAEIMENWNPKPRAKD